MGMATIPGNIKYVFTQLLAPSGEGEVEGSLWYNRTLNRLETYTGLAWTPVSAVDDSGEGMVNIDPWNYSAIIQGAYSFTLATTNLNNAYFQNSSLAVNDSISYKVYLAKGTYTFRTIGTHANVSGILTLCIDGVGCGTQDHYNSPTLTSEPMDTTGITVATSGLKTFTITMATKNGSSTNYLMALNSMAFWRTA